MAPQEIPAIAEVEAPRVSDRYSSAKERHSLAKERHSLAKERHSLAKERYSSTKETEYQEMMKRRSQSPVCELTPRRKVLLERLEYLKEQQPRRIVFDETDNYTKEPEEVAFEKFTQEEFPKEEEEKEKEVSILKENEMNFEDVFGASQIMPIQEFRAPAEEPATTALENAEILLESEMQTDDMFTEHNIASPRVVFKEINLQGERLVAEGDECPKAGTVKATKRILEVPGQEPIVQTVIEEVGEPLFNEALKAIDTDYSPPASETMLETILGQKLQQLEIGEVPPRAYGQWAEDIKDILGKLERAEYLEGKLKEGQKSSKQWAEEIKNVLGKLERAEYLEGKLKEGDKPSAQLAGDMKHVLEKLQKAELLEGKLKECERTKGQFEEDIRKVLGKLEREGRKSGSILSEGEMHVSSLFEEGMVAAPQDVFPRSPRQSGKLATPPRRSGSLLQEEDLQTSDIFGTAMVMAPQEAFARSPRQSGKLTTPPRRSGSLLQEEDLQTSDVFGTGMVMSPQEAFVRSPRQSGKLTTPPRMSGSILCEADMQTSDIFGTPMIAAPHEIVVQSPRMSGKLASPRRISGNLREEDMHTSPTKLAMPPPPSPSSQRKSLIGKIPTPSQLPSIGKPQIQSRIPSGIPSALAASGKRTSGALTPSAGVCPTGIPQSRIPAARPSVQPRKLTGPPPPPRLSGIAPSSKIPSGIAQPSKRPSGMAPPPPPVCPMNKSRPQSLLPTQPACPMNKPRGQLKSGKGKP